MLNESHPVDERLAALAGDDPDATDDRELASHVAGCGRCAAVVSEIGALRTALAELPDMAPPRPLRLLPTADSAPAAADRLGGWVRRFFGPMAAAGAALALVGMVGTTAPMFSGMAGSGDAGTPMQEFAAEETSDALTRDGAAPDLMTAVAEPAAGGGAEEGADTLSGGANQQDAAYDESDDDGATGLPAERSPWPMVLFSGIALLTGALLLRWIVAPRAG